MLSELLNIYYERINKKKGWEDLVSESIKFVSRGANTEGKAAFIQGNNRFLQAVSSAKPQHTLIDADTACVWVAYELVSPKGAKAMQDVLEIWTEREGKLCSCAIYFDTAAFKSFLTQ